jgi:hypothetical protein
MNNNFRNTELLAKLSRNPLQKSMARALDVAEIFAGDVEYLSLNNDLSQLGRENSRRAKLRAAVRDNRDARGPVKQLQARLDAKRKDVAMPPIDRSDRYGLELRKELREVMRSMDRGERALLLASNPAFADAMLETEPLASGLLPTEDFLVKATKDERLAGLYGPQIAEIAELEGTIAEANSIFDLALVDLKLHSEMDDRTFAEFVSPIMNRRNAPWLIRDGDSIVRVRPEKKGSPELHQPATPEEISDGVFFKDESEFRASRAA